MTNEQSAIARLLADLARADAEGTPVEVNREDVREVMALAETGAALDKCLEIALDHNWSVTIDNLRKSGRFGADFNDGVMSPHYAEGATAAEALAALEAEAVTDG